MSKRGLPTGLRMRHDAHYVEELAQHRPTPVGRMIAIDKLDPNTDQPRVEIGDLGELISSVREKGILEPLLVRPSRLNGRWMIIAGERRWRAAREVGLREVPCIEMDVDDREVAEIALIENLQRKDLTPWEEADGLRALCDRYGYTHEEVARKLGKSRSAVTEALSISGLPADVREKCKGFNITSKSILLEIVRQPDDTSMRRIVDEIATKGMTREDARANRRSAVQAPAKSPYIYRYVSPGKDFRLELRFRRSVADRVDIISALQEASERLQAENIAESDNQ